MSTRSPIDSSEADHVGHLAAVAAAAVEVDDDARPPGGDRLKARWSTVNVATVPGTSARRSGCIWSMVWHDRQTRVGGRWRKPQTWQRLAAKAYFHSSERCTVGAPGRSGSAAAAARGASAPARSGRSRTARSSRPAATCSATVGTPAAARAACAAGQRVGRAQDEGVRAVGQRQHDDHLARVGTLEHVSRGPRRPGRRRGCRSSR